MHIKQPENIFILFLFLGHLNTLDFHLRLSCVPFLCHFILDGEHTSALNCCHIIQAFFISSIAGSYTHAQRYINAMIIILPLKSHFHELTFSIPVLYIQF